MNTIYVQKPCTFSMRMKWNRLGLTLLNDLYFENHPLKGFNRRKLQLNFSYTFFNDIFDYWPISGCFTYISGLNFYSISRKIWNVFSEISESKILSSLRSNFIFFLLLTKKKSFWKLLEAIFDCHFWVFQKNNAWNEAHC